MTQQPRFKVIKHRNGTRTLIDNQTGVHFFRQDENSVIQGIKLIKASLPTNTKKFYDNYIICEETMTH